MTPDPLEERLRAELHHRLGPGPDAGLTWDGVERAARGRQRRRRKIMVAATTTTIMAFASAAIVFAVTPGRTSLRTGPAGPPASLPADRKPTTTTSTVAPLLASGKQGLRSEIPWPQIAEGWFLAVASSGLYLVNPLGGRYLIEARSTATWPEGHLADWSGDARRALFTAEKQDGTSVTEVDLATGTSHSFTVAGYAKAVYTRPTGLAITLAAVPISSSYLERVDLNGHKELMFPAEVPGVGRVIGGIVYTADGSELVVGMTGGLGLLTNDGKTVRALPVKGGCEPIRWWSPGVVLASCGDLWTVPISGAAPTDLTQGVRMTNLNAWQLPSGIYLMQGACGSTWLARLGQNAATSLVDVPGTDSQHDVWVVGASGAQLALRVTRACDVLPTATPSPPSQSLVWFNPATDAVTVLLGPPVSSDSVDEALLRRP